MPNVIVTGSRELHDYPFLKERLDFLLRNHTDITFLFDMTKGTSMLAHAYAHEKEFQAKYYLTHWDKYGESAEYERNILMAEDADVLIVFLDGSNKVTEHMIDIMEKANKDVYKVIYENS